MNKQVLKFFKKVSIIVIGLTIFGISQCYADTIISDPSSYKPPEASGYGKAENIANNIITIVSSIGSLVSIVVMLILGIRYMLASAEQKASYKKAMIPYLLGAIFVFAGSTIVQLIYNVATSI